MIFFGPRSRSRGGGGGRRRRMRKSKRGTGKLAGWFNRFRPIRTMSKVLGIVSIATLATTPDSSGFSVIDDIDVCIQTKTLTPLKNTPGHIMSAFTSGAWIAPAVGAVVTGIVSKYTKL